MSNTPSRHLRFETILPTDTINTLLESQCFDYWQGFFYEERLDANDTRPLYTLVDWDDARQDLRQWLSERGIVENKDGHLEQAAMPRETTPLSRHTRFDTSLPPGTIDTLLESESLEYWQEFFYEKPLADWNETRDELRQWLSERGVAVKSDGHFERATMPGETMPVGIWVNGERF